MPIWLCVCSILIISVDAVCLFIIELFSFFQKKKNDTQFGKQLIKNFIIKSIIKSSSGLMKMSTCQQSAYNCLTMIDAYWTFNWFGLVKYALLINNYIIKFSKPLEKMTPQPYQFLIYNFNQPPPNHYICRTSTSMCWSIMFYSKF